ncbi:MAG TPA: hypothetical protein VGR35_12005 [Tepidisphaeraceae bacterium]|nr:hypothetical protein [Tepidisphaeraceae bacterium]
MDNCELRIIDGKRERVLRTGTWEEHVERIKLFSMPNGTYAVVSPTRRLVLRKSGNEGNSKRQGSIEVIEDIGER